MVTYTAQYPVTPATEPLKAFPTPPPPPPRQTCPFHGHQLDFNLQLLRRLSFHMYPSLSIDKYLFILLSEQWRVN